MLYHVPCCQYVVVLEGLGHLHKGLRDAVDLHWLFLGLRKLVSYLQAVHPCLSTCQVTTQKCISQKLMQFKSRERVLKIKVS